MPLPPHTSNPAARTFSSTEFDYATLEHRIRELAFLNSGVRLVLDDRRGVEPVREEMHYEGGLQAYVEYLDKNKNRLHDAVIFIVGVSPVTVSV